MLEHDGLLCHLLDLDPFDDVPPDEGEGVSDGRVVSGVVRSSDLAAFGLPPFFPSRKLKFPPRRTSVGSRDVMFPGMRASLPLPGAVASRFDLGKG